MASPSILACEELLNSLSAPKPQFHFQAIASLEQLYQLWEIDRDAYQEQSLSFERFQEWWERYELGSRVLLEGDRILASLGLYPVSCHHFDKFTAGLIPERDLLPLPLEQCEESPASCWYASGIVVSPSARGWGKPHVNRLMSYAFHQWVDSGHISYPLQVAAIAEYEQGAKLLQALGFQKLQDGYGLPDGCDLYWISFASEEEVRSLLRSRGL